MPAAGRLIEVDVERLLGWVERFADRHGQLTAALASVPPVLRLAATDGAAADLAIPYGRPLDNRSRSDADPRSEADPPSATAEVTTLVTMLVDRVLAPRTVGILLVRRGGWAAGVVTNGELIDADTGGGHVQGKTRAGGWSQQRYARRRDNQARQVYDRAAAGAVGVLLPHRDALDALVTGGDRAAITALLADPGLAGLASPVEPRFFAVPDPTRSVLHDVVRRLRTVAITLNERA